jgi:hypothetical protein
MKDLTLTLCVFDIEDDHQSAAARELSMRAHQAITALNKKLGAVVYSVNVNKVEGPQHADDRADRIHRNLGSLELSIGGTVFTMMPGGRAQMRGPIPLPEVGGQGYCSNCGGAEDEPLAQEEIERMNSRVRGDHFPLQPGPRGGAEEVVKDSCCNCVDVETCGCECHGEPEC